jgi:hypothetical protein
MAPCTTASRRAALALSLLATGFAGPAPGAAAQSGNGLYEPFPEAAVKKRAQRYVERLGDRNPEAGRRYSDAELAAGVFVRPDRQGDGLSASGGGSPRGAASARAGGGGAEMALPLQLLLLAAALALPAAAFANRARSCAA